MTCENALTSAEIDDLIFDVRAESERLRGDAATVAAYSNGRLVPSPSKAIADSQLFKAPTVYSAAVTYTDALQSIDESGVIYAPVPSFLPIGPEVFDSSHWYVLQGTGVPKVTEQRTLLTGQRTVVFSDISTSDAAFYISGKNVDTGRLYEGEDYIATGINDDTILLTNSWPAGSIVLGDGIKVIPQSFQNAAQTSYDNSNSEFSGANVQDVLDEIGIVGPQLVAASATLYAYNNLG